MGGIVKRARKPGCKHDELMVLIGPEDTLKSSFCRKLGLSDDWFSDSIKNEGSDQNLIPQLFGHLVIELAELDMSKRDADNWKAFLNSAGGQRDVKVRTARRTLSAPEHLHCDDQSNEAPVVRHRQSAVPTGEGRSTDQHGVAGRQP